MAGEEDGAPVKLSQLREASGYLLVADGTRSKTLETALSIRERVEREIGKQPFLFLVNKADLRDSWQIPDSELSRLATGGWTILETSARTGERVEEAFLTLVSSMLKAGNASSSDEDD
jgi:signal recognition particle receptor subunit beta